jgi:hypothetical protein
MQLAGRTVARRRAGMPETRLGRSQSKSAMGVSFLCSGHTPWNALSEPSRKGRWTIKIEQLRAFRDKTYATPSQKTHREKF